MSRVDADATAVGDREPGFEINITAAWPGSDPDPGRYKLWAREGWQALSPHAEGVYANFISDEGTSGVEAAYHGRLGRLRRVKAIYDPDNFFRSNVNITPREEQARS